MYCTAIESKSLALASTSMCAKCKHDIYITDISKILRR